MGMKRSKRISALFLALVMCLSLFPTTAFADNDNTGEEVQQNTAEPVHEHSWSGWTVVTEATCSLVGLQQRSCACGATETAEIPAVPHNYGEWTVTKEATCTEAGEQQHVCAVCGGVENAAIPALPHDYGAWTVTEEPTCTEAGEQQHACTVCGVVETAAVPVEPHQFGAWTMTKEPTCTAAGEQQHACTVCGEIETSAVPTAPHQFGTWEVTREATCTREGKQEHTCAVCGEVEKESIPVIPHSYGEWEVTREATCTKEGKQEHTCAVCGEVEKESIPVIPHNFGEWEVAREATCTKEGKQEHTCSICGEVEKESIPVIPHSYGEWTVTREATCTKEGVRERVCTDCEETEKEAIPLAEHVWDEEGVCTVCGEKKEEEDRMPAQSFSGAAGGLFVSVEAGEGVFPEKTVMTVFGAGIGVEQLVPLFHNAVNASGVTLSFTQNGKEVYPAGAIMITLSAANPNAEAEYEAFCLAAGTVTSLGSAFGGSSATFLTDSLSIFGLVESVEQPEEAIFTVCFFADEELVEERKAKENDAVGALPDAPEKKHYDFVAWMADGTEVTAETAVTEDMNVTAEYKLRMPAANFQKGAGGVSVSVSAEEGTFPEGTVMTVVAVAASASLATLSNVLDQEVAEARIVDITFWSEGREIQPEKPVSVTLSVGAFVQEEDVSVVHFSDDGGVSVVASGINGSAASFAAEHFSRYGVVVPSHDILEDESMFPKSVEELFENSADRYSIGFYISAQSGYLAHNVYYMRSNMIDTSYYVENEETGNYETTKIQMIERTAANDIFSAMEFHLDRGNGNNPDYPYRIYTVKGGAKYYLQTEFKKNDLILVEENETNTGTLFSVEFDDKGVIIKSEDTRYINLKAKDPGYGFQGISEKNRNKYLKEDGPIRLVFSNKITDEQREDPYDLDGKSFAILFDDGNGSGRVMTSTAVQNTKLSSQPVSVDGLIVDAGEGNNLITWMFVPTGNGHYILSTKINNQEKYFKFDGTAVKLDDNRANATELAVSPGTADGTIEKNGPSVNGKYRISWLPSNNTKGTDATALQVATNFYAVKKNDNARLEAGQWLYLAQTSFTVIYYKDDGKTVFAEFTDKEYGDSIEIPSGPAKDADTKYTYTFDKWELVSGTALNGNKVAGDATYKATYTRTPQNYKVIYEVDGKQYKSETAAFKVEVTLIGNPTKEGYTFSGWSSEDVTISEGKFTMPDHDVRIVGSFTGNPDSLTYDANGGTGTTAETKGNVGDTVKTAKNGFTRTGYKFQKWNTQADGKGTDYAENADYVLTAGADKLYAIWEADTNVVVTISAVQDTVLYDGAPHTVIGFLAQSNNAEYNKNIDDNFSYSVETPEVTGTNAGTYTVDLQAMVNSCKNENTKFANVTFRVNPNNRYDVLTITPRTVIMTSASDEKDYDGEALTNENVTITGDGFVGGQGAAYTFTGTQTEEGSSQNSFTYTLTGGALANNYNITTNFGTLTVNAAAGNEDIEDDETPKAETPEDIDENDTPMAIMKNWALLNLIAMILTVCTAAGMIITYFKKKDEDEGEDEEDGHSKGKFLGLIPGVGSVITFLLTEDVTTNMVMTDKWTVLMIAILAIGAALAWLTRNEKPEEEQPEGV